MAWDKLIKKCLKNKVIYSVLEIQRNPSGMAPVQDK